MCVCVCVCVRVLQLRREISVKLYNILFTQPLRSDRIWHKVNF